MAAPFEVAAGTVAGRDHRRLGRNNQDACSWWQDEDVTLAVVADGCGSGTHSEVGARLGARVLVEALRRRRSELGGPCTLAALAAAEREMLGWVAALSDAIGGPLDASVSEHFLFTVVGAVVARPMTYVFVAGDGLVAVNGDVEVFASAENAPSYPAYALVRDGPADPQFRIVRTIETDGLQSLVLGTDGAVDLVQRADDRLPGREERLGPFRQLWDDDRHFTNPFALGRRLALANAEATRVDWAGHRLLREPGLLKDDTTVVVLRRRTAERGVA